MDLPSQTPTNRVETRVAHVLGDRPNRTPGVMRRWKRAVLRATYASLAERHGGPGVGAQRRIVEMSANALRSAPEDIRPLLRALQERPLDSFRYFELEFCFGRLRELSHIGRVLDVSSPRVFPLLLLAVRPESIGHLLNPDQRDLALTRALATSWGLGNRCTWHERPLGAAEFGEGSMDLVTSISVVEHIADDSAALRTMWRFVRPGGRLLITVPVAAEGFEEYMDVDVYGTSPAGPDGWSFASRYYSESQLRRRIVSVVGEPSQTAVYGEREAGRFFAMRARKWVDPDYPYWREPYVIATDFGLFPSIADLPGIGVVGMEWIKRGESES